MHLYFLRHGVAEDAPPGGSDAERKLTDAGRAAVRRGAEALGAAGVRFDLCLTSPYPRASETARITQSVLGFESLEEEAEMRSGAFGMGELQSLLADAPRDAHVLLVGHNPDLSIIVGQLSGAVVELKKGGVACVEARRVEPGGGSLVWLLTPKLLLGLSGRA